MRFSTVLLHIFIRNKKPRPSCPSTATRPLRRFRPEQNTATLPLDGTPSTSAPRSAARPQNSETLWTEIPLFVQIRELNPQRRSPTVSSSSQSPLAAFENALIELTQTRSGRRAFLSSIPFLMAACASAPQHRQREGDNAGQETALTVDDERKLTAEALQEMKKDYPKVQDPAMQSYISNLGSKIVRANNLEGQPYNYNFSVVDVPYVNAFALPAGTVFVTAPLIAMADNEAELAGVVGHEVGHIKARHTAERMEAAKREEGKSWLLGAGGGLLGGALGFGVGKLVCPPKDNECLLKAAGLGVAAGAGAGLLIHKYKFMANSREDEMEADRIGFRTAYNAGYSKEHVGNFYSKLLAMEQKSKKENIPVLSSIQDAMSTHPPSQERVSQMNQMTSEVPAQRVVTVSTREFDRVKKQVLEMQRVRAQQKPAGA